MRERKQGKNYAIDFRLDLIPGGEDLEYSFRFGKCADFKGAMALVKQIPWPGERSYDPDDDHRWTVKASPRNLELLCQAFDNFRGMYEAAKSQRPLPGF